jgi:hypothetical protein
VLANCSGYQVQDSIPDQEDGHDMRTEEVQLRDYVRIAEETLPFAPPEAQAK